MQKEFLSVQQAINQANGHVNIRGWVYRERGSSMLRFIVLRDSTNVIQCVIKKGSVSEKTWIDAEKLLIESSLEIHGTIKEDKRAPTGFEVEVIDLNVVQFAEKYPITKDQSPEFLLDKRHLWIRSRKLTSVMKIRHTVFQAFRRFFDQKGFIEFPPPILHPSQCEGGSTLFEVKYYNDKTYLTQSWQLYAEAAIFSLENIYCISPCFRAEKSKTSRHLSEFWMAEMESAWADLDKICKYAEEVIEFIVSEVVNKNEPELKILGQDVEKLKKIKAPFPRLKYSDVLKILKEKDNIDIPWGKDLRTIEEDTIMKHYELPLIVTHYPKEIMAFYKPSDLKNPKEALCLDILAPEGYGEIVGGSQRETDMETLRDSLEKVGEKLENYEWYLDLRRFGSVPHAGFGLGVERVVAWICKLDNIKDAIPFPRTLLRKGP